MRKITINKKNKERKSCWSKENILTIRLSVLGSIPDLITKPI